MKSLKKVAIVGVAVLLAGILWLLYDKTRGGSFAVENDAIAHLRELEAQDAEWTVDSLRAKTGINRNYAAGQTPGERAAATGQQLANAVATLQYESVHKAAQALNETVRQKQSATARFIGQNAILRESLEFVTNESAELLAQLRELQDDALRRRDSKTTESLTTLGLRINELLTETLKYNLLSDVAALPRIDSSLEDLAQRTASYPADLAPTIAALIEKFRSVKRQKAVEDAILNEIAALPMQQHIAAFEQAIEAEKRLVTQSANFYRGILIAYSAALLALLGWFAWRLAHSYGLIQRTNAELASLNENLEKRVDERTVELADALQHLKESESALIQSEKMSSLGQMIAGVAHEINTPLAYVRSGLEVLKEGMPHGSALADETLRLLQLLSAEAPSEDELSAQFARVQQMCLEAQQGHDTEELSGVIRDGLYGIDQISEIVMNLKNFSRLDRAKVSRFSLNEGLDSTLVIAKNLVKTKTIHKEYGPGADIEGSPSQINQVFLNLVSNAAQATGADGVIVLRTRRTGDKVCVEIEDNGSGIPPDVLPKIFDPFFTTKKVGEGTGLGLSIAYKIVNEHGGTIDVDSEVGRGTRFRITLPAGVAADRALEDTIPDGALLAAA